jgi:uncharacterized protein
VNRILAIAAILFALGCPAAAPAQTAPEPRVNAGLARTTLSVAGHGINVEVADTPGTRETGLMNRFSIPPDEGMLFVFPSPQPLAFWMHNTYMPLSIAFIDADGRVLNVDDMAPRTDDSHPSHGEALYALEMRQGWFRRHGVDSGVVVKGLPPASRQ